MHFVAILLSFLGIFQLAKTDYAPVQVSCPSTSLIRESFHELSPKEKSFIKSRYHIAKQNLRQFLQSSNLVDFDIDSYLSQCNPTIGIAISGGSYRSELTGAGAIEALDSRTSDSSSRVKGILQSSSYISGLSGGGWFLGSFVNSNYQQIDQLKNSWTINSLIDYYGADIIKEVAMWVKIASQIQGKQNQGFDVSITDLYGRALSYVFLSQLKDEGENSLWSNIPNLSNFATFQMPFPILVSDGREPDTIIINSNSTVFEFNPYEFGSFDSALGKFVDIKFLGSDLDNGDLLKCINGFDNSGFLMGTSSSLFNEVFIKIAQFKNLPSFLKDLINKFIVDPIEKLNIDIANYPNPFYNSGAKDEILKSKYLHLVDGGEDGQNLPIEPLLKRNLSVIFTFDNSNDWSNWPDGSSLIKTYERQFTKQNNGLAFPYVPDQKTFKYLNLTSKPTFFGCDAKNLTSLTEDIYNVPLVIYFANRPFSYWSNTSTWKLTYSDRERDSMILNGYEIATRKNGTLDKEFEACVSCAIIRRQQELHNLEQSKQCKQCFERYCWDGKLYTGDFHGENFSDDGLIENASEYSSTSVSGFNDGGADI